VRFGLAYLLWADRSDTTRRFRSSRQSWKTIPTEQPGDDLPRRCHTLTAGHSSIKAKRYCCRRRLSIQTSGAADPSWTWASRIWRPGRTTRQRGRSFNTAVTPGTRQCHRALSASHTCTARWAGRKKPGRSLPRPALSTRRETTACMSELPRRMRTQGYSDPKPAQTAEAGCSARNPISREVVQVVADAVSRPVPRRGDGGARYQQGLPAVLRERAPWRRRAVPEPFVVELGLVALQRSGHVAGDGDLVERLAAHAGTIA
jgi:hypothetical protein